MGNDGCIEGFGKPHLQVQQSNEALLITHTDQVFTEEEGFEKQIVESAIQKMESKVSSHKPIYDECKDLDVKFRERIAVSKQCEDFYVPKYSENAIIQEQVLDGQLQVCCIDFVKVQIPTSSSTDFFYSEPIYDVYNDNLKSL